MSMLDFRIEYRRNRLHLRNAVGKIVYPRGSLNETIQVAVCPGTTR